jgi:photosystem II stability/assembly factor-like uncharacterized protein
MSVDAVAADDAWAVGGGDILHWDGAQWRIAQQLPGQQLWSVSMVSPTDGWIAGNGATLLRWNGQSWNSFPYPGGNTLRALDILSSTEGWAEGS